jgi:hypothetical protein
MSNPIEISDGHPHKHFDKVGLVGQLCEVIDDSNKMADEVLEHLDVVLLKLDELLESKDIFNDIDGIKNNIFTIMSSLQAQDAHRQKIERVVNEIDPENSKFAPSANHITGDTDTADLVSDDELAALVAQMGCK